MSLTPQRYVRRLGHPEDQPGQPVYYYAMQYDGTQACARRIAQWAKCGVFYTPESLKFEDNEDCPLLMAGGYLCMRPGLSFRVWPKELFNERFALSPAGAEALATLNATLQNTGKAAKSAGQLMRRLLLHQAVAKRLAQIDTTPEGNIARAFIYNSRMNALRPTGEHLLRAYPHAAFALPAMTLEMARTLAAAQGLPIPLAVYQRGIYDYMHPAVIAELVASWAKQTREFEEKYPQSK